MAERTCPGCGDPLQGDPRRKYCSDQCRQRGHRGQTVTDVPEETGLAAQVEDNLKKAGRLDTIDGQQALLIARQLGAKVVNTSGLASLSKEFSRVYAAAMAGAEEVKGDAVDEITERRRAKRRAS